MNIVIVGAGPCGIMSAIRTKHLHPDYDVTLIEKNDYIGQRIKVSGNGRCNFSNTNFGPNKYNHPEFIHLDYALISLGNILQFQEREF